MHSYTRASTSKLHVVFSSFMLLHRSELCGIYEMAQKLNNSHITFSGSGKSCLLGSWSLHHQEKFPNDAVVYHFVGSSSDSTGKQYSILVAINELLKPVHPLNQQQFRQQQNAHCMNFLVISEEHLMYLQLKIIPRMCVGYEIVDSRKGT